MENQRLRDKFILIIYFGVGMQSINSAKVNKSKITLIIQRNPLLDELGPRSRFRMQSLTAICAGIQAI
jgi:hypothetical protein